MSKFKVRTLSVLVFIVLAAMLLSGCGKKANDSKDDATYQSPVSTNELDRFKSTLDFGAKQYEDVQGVPLYVGSSEESRSIGGNVLTVIFNINATPEEFTTFYERELPNFGWDIVKKAVDESSIKLEASKSGRLATIRAEIVEGKISTYKIIAD
jgi:uncharacterized lipoprotein